eukprot:8558909-Ditylum_brightwellii.AAC.1
MGSSTPNFPVGRLSTRTLCPSTICLSSIKRVTPRKRVGGVLPRTASSSSERRKGVSYWTHP